MAHSNHYFHLKTGTQEDRHVDLLARDEPDMDNGIQMVVHGPIYGTTNTGEIGIWLSKEQQDKLIAGILERRGMYQSYLYDLTNEGPIDPYGNQKSLICPPKT